MATVQVSDDIDTLLRSASRAAAVGSLCPWVAISADTTLTASQRGSMIAATAGTSGITLTLPTLAGGDAGWNISVRRMDRSYGNIVVSGSGFSDVIRVSGTIVLYQWSGSAWYVARRYGPLESQANPNQFGSAIDGDMSVTTTITLTDDLHCRNLAISGSGIINTSGYRIFVDGDLDLRNAGAGAIQFNGVAGANAVGATPGGAGTQTTGNTAGGGTGTPQAGATGTTGAGVQASNVASTALLAGIGISRAAQGAAGGAGTNAGGASRTSSAGLTQFQPRVPVIDVLFRGVLLNGGGTGQAGSSGGGDGTNSGGGGGGNGKGGGCVQVYARRALVGSSTNASAIRAIGGNGGNGGTPVAGNCGGGGGAGGGQGGSVFLVAGEIVGTTTSGGADISGGSGGNGGNGEGTGAAGNGGHGGGRGRAVILNLSAGTVSISPETDFGGANIGQTGRAGAVQLWQIAEAT